MAVCERVDRRKKAVMDGPEEGRRRDRIPEMIVEEVAQATGRLERGHVGVQIQAVDTPDRKRHVLADNVGDVGRHRGPFVGRSTMGPRRLVGLRRSFTGIHGRFVPGVHVSERERQVLEVIAR